ncbi:hypothetical protein [Paracoccus sp. AS002]|uniref:hypothetical protein n=1 Tax=Paracoccus sp. AS002 TaxID=3019545 RepID=UPI0023E8A274|nr:hypothetical protein [Paracoccus sp. AS002]MDF3904699.1 hypothetical protein [Paracoccus sp. AS002]
MAFIFGGNTGTTYEQMLRQRSLADAYAQGIGTPRTFGEGLSALGKGLAAGLMNRSANKTEAAGKKAAEEKRQGVLAQLFGQRFGGGPVSAQGLALVDAGGIPDVNVPQVPVGPHSSDPRQDVSGGFAGSAAASGQNFPMSLVQSESGGNWQALNNEGYGGRLQFGKDRLADAARAGVIPAGMTGAQFSQLPPEAQQAVEQWHFADIDRQAERMGLNSYIGQTVAGIPITQDGIRAMAHLGGIGGAAKFLQSGGQYNPADSNGTSLADYAAKHGGGSLGGFSGGGGYSDPMAGIDMGAVTAALSDPFLDEGSKSVIAMALQDRIKQRNAIQQQQMDPWSGIQEINGRLVRMTPQGPQVIGDFSEGPKPTDDMREYDYAVSQGYQGSFQDFMIDMKRAGASSTNVNVGSGGQNIGTIPQGFAAVPDPSNPSGFRMEAIPGGPEDTSKQDAAKSEAAQTSGDVILNAAVRARDAAANRQFGAFGQGVIGAVNPYSDSAEVQRQVSVLKANATIEALNAMRAQSPTGGALGNVTEGEGQMLAAKAGALDPSSPNFERDLADYTRTLLQTIHGREAGEKLFSQQWEAAAQQQEMSDEEYLRSLGLE